MKTKLLLIGFAGLCSICVSLSAFSETPSRHAPTTKHSHSWSDGIYIKAGVGGIKYRDFKTLENLYTSKKAPKGSLVYHGGIGYKINENFRTDFTLYFTEMKHKAMTQDDHAVATKQKIKSLAGFLNGYAQIELQKSFYPYVTAGIGFTRNKVGNFIQEEDPIIVYQGENKTGLAWNVGAGLGFNITKHFAIDAGYRFVGLYKISIKDLNSVEKGGSQKIRGHQGLISLICNF